MSNLSKLAMALGLKFGPVRNGVTPRRVLEYTVRNMVSVQTESKIATDPNALVRADGAMEAYKNVANFIAPSSSIVPSVD